MNLGMTANKELKVSISELESGPVEEIYGAIHNAERGTVQIAHQTVQINKRVLVFRKTT